jgi:predicted acetyltransferase
MAEQIEVRRATVGEKLILRHLMQLYSYDFSEFDGTDTDDYGLYRYDYIDHYWTEKDRHPYLVRVAGKFAGFALIKINVRNDGTSYTYMSEFFIMRKYRGQGVGQAVAHFLFDLYPGEWEVSEIAENDRAQAFWRKIIGRYTNDQFEETTLEDGEVIQMFNNAARQAS